MAIEITVQSGPGPAGVGVPTGGTTGQALVKNSDANFDTVWASTAIGGSIDGGDASSIYSGDNFDFGGA